jgi:hypothetical protein
LCYFLDRDHWAITNVVPNVVHLQEDWGGLGDVGDRSMPHSQNFCSFMYFNFSEHNCSSYAICWDALQPHYGGGGNFKGRGE